MTIMAKAIIPTGERLETSVFDHIYRERRIQMKKLLSPAAILILLVFGRAVSASETVGWITFVDERNDQIVLDDGRTFSLSDEINFGSLADGRHVRVIYETIGGIPTATRVVLMPPVATEAAVPSLEQPTPVCKQMVPYSESGRDGTANRFYC
jgi:hypothetical protein